MPNVMRTTTRSSNEGLLLVQSESELCGTIGPVRPAGRAVKKKRFSVEQITSVLQQPAHVAGSPWISPCVEFARATVSISLWTARGFRIVCNMRCDLSRICLWLPRSRSEVPDNQIRVTPRVPALGRANVTATPRP
jgi:hypothetical protein